MCIFTCAFPPECVLHKPQGSRFLSIFSFSTLLSRRCLNILSRPFFLMFQIALLRCMPWIYLKYKTNSQKIFLFKYKWFSCFYLNRLYNPNIRFKVKLVNIRYVQIGYDGAVICQNCCSVGNIYSHNEAIELWHYKINPRNDKNYLPELNI